MTFSLALEAIQALALILLVLSLWGAGWLVWLFVDLEG